jgi:hypothetical protein
MENVKNPLVFFLKTKKNSPQDGCQMVKMDLIHVKLLHTNITTYSHINMHTLTIYALILNTPNSSVH